MNSNMNGYGRGGAGFFSNPSSGSRAAGYQQPAMQMRQGPSMMGMRGGANSFRGRMDGSFGIRGGRGMGGPTPGFRRDNGT